MAHRYTTESPRVGPEGVSYPKSDGRLSWVLRWDELYVSKFLWHNDLEAEHHLPLGISEKYPSGFIHMHRKIIFYYIDRCDKEDVIENLHKFADALEVPFKEILTWTIKGVG